MRRLTTALLLPPLAGCAALGQGPTTLSGPWGGAHIGLLLEGGLGAVEFDCASGTIDEPIPVSKLPFRVSGTYRAGQGGPVRVGQIFVAQRATYSGSATKDEMTLSVTLEDGTPLGPFTLRRGAAPEVTRCL